MMKKIIIPVLAATMFMFSCSSDDSTPEDSNNTDTDVTTGDTITDDDTTDTTTYDENAFVIEFTTTDNQKTVKLPIYSGASGYSTSYNFSVDWGDGTTSDIYWSSDTAASHTYDAAGAKEIIITGTLLGFNFNAGSYNSANILTDIKQWGSVQLGNINPLNSGAHFFECTSLESFSATDTPNLSGISNLADMFKGCTNFNGDVSDWDVSEVTKMSAMFYNCKKFNGDVSGWDVSKVTNMGYMFTNTSVFNQNISSWNVANVTDMSSMFSNATVFNQDISSWATDAVTSCSSFSYGSALTAENSPIKGCFEPK